MALLDYPQNFLDEQGNPKPGVYGPSPASIGLLSAGLGMLSAPTYSRVPGDMSGIGQGAMQGLQAYQNRMNQIMQQRQAYNQSLMQAQNQEMRKQQFQAQVDERKRLATQRERRKSQLPMLLEQIRNLGTPGIEQQVMGIQAMGDAGNIDGAYQAVTNILGQKIPEKAELEYKEFGDNVIIINKTTGKPLMQFNKSNTSSSKDGLFEGSGGGKAFLNVLFENLKTPENPGAGLAYESYYLTPDRITVSKDPTDPNSPLVTKEIYPKIPESLRSVYEPLYGKQPEPKIIEGTEKVKAPSDTTRKSYGFAERMVDSLTAMDEIEKDGYRPGIEVYNYATSPSEATRQLMLSGMSTQDKIYVGHMQNWIRANLRLESGAAIPPEEMEGEYRTYFYTPGVLERFGLTQTEDADVNKIFNAYRDNRVRTTKNMITQAGNLWKKGDPKFVNPYDPKKPESNIETNNAPVKPDDKKGEEILSKYNLPKKKSDRQIKYTKANKPFKVEVLSGDGASDILNSIGVEPTVDNINRLIAANKKRFKNKMIKDAGGFLLIPPVLRK